MQVTEAASDKKKKIRGSKGVEHLTELKEWLKNLDSNQCNYENLSSRKVTIQKQ